MAFPRMVKIRQKFNREGLENPAAELAVRLRETGFLSNIAPGARIAVAAGSRGIRGIAAMIRTVVEELKGAGADPFIVPAMGSHGGAPDTATAIKRLRPENLVFTFQGDGD